MKTTITILTVSLLTFAGINTVEAQYRMTVSEFRPHFIQEYTLSLRDLVRFTLFPDTSGYNKDAVHFVLQTKDSVLMETSVNG